MKSNVTHACVRVLPAGIFLALMAGLSGCASQVYNVKVDAIRNPEIALGYSYRIIDRDASRATADPRHAEAVQLVKTALAGRGMYEATVPALAEVEIIVDYGVGPQRLKVENYDPNFGPTMARAPLAIVQIRKADGSTTLAAFPAEQLDIDGTFRGLPVLRGAHVYEKYLIISARETAAAVGAMRKPGEAWHVQASVEDKQDSLEGYLPILAGAAADHLGTDTAKSERKRLRQDAEIVAFVKSGR